MAKGNKYIKLTKQSIEEMFDECNAAYFNGEVEKPKKFETWTPEKKCLGLSRPILNQRQRTGKVTSALHISRRYNWTANALKQVVLHEMIHLLIEDYKRPLTFMQRLPLIGCYFIRQHDDEFINKMNELNSTFNLNIKVRFSEMRAEFRG